jgi:hypothetical protein
MPRVNRYRWEEVTQAKRTCPKCRRRFQFQITWHADRANEIQSERISDYKRLAKKETRGKFVMVHYAGDYELPLPAGAFLVQHLYRDYPSTGKPKLNRVVFRFEKARDARKYADEHNCPRFRFSRGAKETAWKWSQSELEAHFGPGFDQKDG